MLVKTNGKVELRNFLWYKQADNARRKQLALHSCTDIYIGLLSLSKFCLCPNNANGEVELRNFLWYKQETAFKKQSLEK